MTDYRTTLERDLRRIGPASFTFVDLGRRRDRRQRNRRMGSAAIAIAIAIGAGLLVGRSWFAHRTVPANSPTPSPVYDRKDGVIWEGMWPEATLADARAVQRLADQGDPEAGAQLASGGDFAPRDEAPGDSLTRLAVEFASTELGWDGVKVYSTGTPEQDRYHLQLLRCGPEPNEFFPGEECAPTIDRTHHLIVGVRFEQPVTQGARGIWVITRATGHSFFRPLPPSEQALRNLLARFYQARVDGSGAEGFGAASAAYGDLLYATSQGSSYERFDIVRLSGPEWESRSYETEVRLVAEDGTVVHERELNVTPDAFERGHLAPWNEHGPYGWFPYQEVVTGTPPPTTLREYGFVPDLGPTLPEGWEPTDGEFEFRLGPRSGRSGIAVVSDPLAVDVPCATSPTSSGDLIARLRASSALVTSEPVSASVAGLSGMRLDVAPAEGGGMAPCDSRWTQLAPIIASPTPPDGVHYHPSVLGLERGQRGRLYVLEAPRPDGRTGTIAILVVAGDQGFDRVLGQVAPILERFRLTTL